MNITKIEHSSVPFENYEGWELGLTILGEIKALEALPNLIQCLDCNNGLGGLSLYRYPVAYAVSMIGEEAIPYLEKALLESDKSNTYGMCAILALTKIGGKKAEKSFERLLLSGKMEHFGKLIERALTNLKTKSQN